MKISDEANAMLARMAQRGGQSSDVVARRPGGNELMQKGLIELVKPEGPYLPYAQITKSGWRRVRGT